MGHCVAEVGDGGDVDPRRILGLRRRCGHGDDGRGGQRVLSSRCGRRYGVLELVDSFRDVGRSDGAQQEFGRVDGAVSLGITELSGVCPLIADLAQLLRIDLGLPGHGLVEGIAEFPPETLGHRAQHEGKVAALVFAASATVRTILCPQQFGPVSARWEQPVEHLTDKRRQATGQCGQRLPHEGMMIDGVHCSSPPLAFFETLRSGCDAANECPCGIAGRKGLNM